MATIKSYTDIEQSKKLAEILPLESADMYYHQNRFNEFMDYPHFVEEYKSMVDRDINYNDAVISCWSLAALLDAIPYNVTFNKAVYRFKLVKFTNHWECYHENFGTVSTEIFKADNPVDACYEMILKLHELNLL